MSADSVQWEPDGYYLTESNIARFIDRFDYDSVDDLVPDSEDALVKFWDAAVSDTGMVWEEEYRKTLDTADGPAFANWFVDGRLNATRTMVDKWVERAPDRVAYVWENENGRRETLTYAELDDRTNRLANALRREGIGPGDVVALLFSLHPAAMVATLACLKVGAVQTQIFAGYGATAIEQRLADSEASLVLQVDGYLRRGNRHNLVAKMNEVDAGATDCETAIVKENIGGIRPHIEGLETRSWSSFVADTSTVAEPTIVDADVPALIAYTSGTTGTPKGTIQTQASLLAMGLKESKYVLDVHEGDVFTWATDFGWMAVPVYMQFGTLPLGATTVLLEGAPTAPRGDRLWNVVETHEVTIFGTSPTGARRLRAENERPRQTHDLSTLRVLASTGEPWDDASWEWYFEAVGGERLPIINVSGGTEVAGHILASTVLSPLRTGTLCGPAPGTAAAVYDSTGNRSTEGFLVIEQPLPGMTKSLTAGDDRYVAEYWSDFPGVWNQNDWVVIEDDHWYITGRADDAMNISGRRVTAQQIEAAILQDPDIEAAAVIDWQDTAGNVRPVAFVMTDMPEDTVIGAVEAAVETHLGAPYRPSAVHLVEELPRTQTGKIPRGRIKQAYGGAAIGDVSTLEHGEVLAGYPTAGSVD